MRASKANVPWSTCRACGKRTYSSRKDARRAAHAGHPGEHLSAYPCPAGRGWHLGNLAHVVIAGHWDRATTYRGGGTR